MRDLSIEDVFDDPDGSFGAFVAQCVDLWNYAVRVYESAESPLGPAEEGNNLTTWVLRHIDELEAVETVEQLLGLD